MSRAGQFNESRAHQRRAGRAGGFGGGGGGGGGLPEPGESMLRLESSFLYDYHTGAEAGGFPFVHLFPFDVDLKQVGHERHYTEQDQSDGFYLPTRLKGGAGVFWMQGYRSEPQGDPVVGWQFSARGGRTGRFTMEDYRIGGGPRIGDCFINGSGNIGNLEGFAYEHSTDVDTGNVRERHGIARYDSGRLRFSDAVNGPVPDFTLDQKCDGTDGTIVKLDGGVFSRWRVTRNPFRIDLASRQDVDREAPNNPIPYDQNLYDEMLTVLGGGFECGGGRDFWYSPCLLRRRDGRFPPYRAGIVRVFIDFDNLVGDGPVWYYDAVGVTDFGTQQTFERFAGGAAGD